MPRYFFHVYDGSSSPDADGTELPDIYTAQAQAIRTSGEILRDMGAQFWDGTAWRLEVADARGLIAPDRRALPELVAHAAAVVPVEVVGVAEGQAHILND